MTSSPKVVSALVAKFARNIDAYKSQSYNETQLRREFLDPLFEALGWDVANHRGYSEAYKSVVHEDRIRADEGQKWPDYSFRIGGTRKFFLEAKKPAVNIRMDPGPAYQLRRYSWSAKLAIGVLTDFEELAIYDTRKKPLPEDGPGVARMAVFRYDELETRWDELSGLLSEDAVLKGDLDRFIGGKGTRRGTEEVDQAFLAEIEGWRVDLAKMFAKHNAGLDAEAINAVVQATIDRIVFLRICEDRNIEAQGSLRACADQADVYSALVELFRKADARYNSGLFHFSKERGRASLPDTISLGLNTDSRTFKGILEGLYFPKSPYEFSVLPADTLGQVYERFLGSVIRLTQGHRAVVEEKPEVRKAGGVYYTPTHIVDRIVERTLTPLFSGLNPAKAASIRILDPACGSGTFLLQAYEFLLKWYLDFYTRNNPKSRVKGDKAVLRERKDGLWDLSIVERKRILSQHIFGVDIDAQAVEVTKLSLLLRVLEGASLEQLSFLPERALPDLDGNIRRGNSLLNSQYYTDAELLGAGEGDPEGVIPFDWEDEFPSIMAKGGFDAVIGNPPYVLLQWAETPNVEAYLAANYRAARYKIDTYLVFMEKGVSLLRKGGRFGFIVSSSWFRNKYARELRAYLLSNTQIDALTIFEYPVFKAMVDTCAVIMERVNKPRKDHNVEVSWAVDAATIRKSITVAQGSWLANPNHEISARADSGAIELTKKMMTRGVPLGTFATAYFGIQTHGRKKYVATEKRGATYEPVIDGSNIARWAVKPATEFVETRPEAIKSGGDSRVYSMPRVVLRQIGSTPWGAIVAPGILTLNTIYNVYFTKQTRYRLEFVLGVFASKAGRWYWQMVHADEKQAYPKIKKEALLAFPVPRIDWEDTTSRGRHDRVVDVVQRLGQIGEQLLSPLPEAKVAKLEQRMTSLEADLDEVVAECYGLSSPERAQVIA